MRNIVIFSLLAISWSLAAEGDWHGFCIVEVDQMRICSAHYPRTRDFANICNTFAVAERAPTWTAQFFNSLEFLRSSIPDYCDIVRDGGSSGFFACLSESYCPNTETPQRRHLASRVYAENETEAVAACFAKEENRYVRELREQSSRGCYTRIVVEPSIIINEIPAL